MYQCLVPFPKLLGVRLVLYRNFDSSGYLDLVFSECVYQCLVPFPKLHLDCLSLEFFGNPLFWFRLQYQVLIACAKLIRVLKAVNRAGCLANFEYLKVWKWVLHQRNLALGCYQLIWVLKVVNRVRCLANFECLKVWNWVLHQRNLVQGCYQSNWIALKKSAFQLRKGDSYLKGYRFHRKTRFPIVFHHR